MKRLTEMLQNLDCIASNPNLNGGVWNSFQLFIEFSDYLLQNKDLLQNLESNTKHTNEELIQELENIRENFTKEFGFRLGTNNGLNERFEVMKNGRQSHKFKAKISNFMQNYKNRLI